MKHCIAFIVFFLICSCASNKTKNRDNLNFHITNKAVRDGDTLKIELVNTTAKNYYLIFNPASVYNKFAPFAASRFLYTCQIGIEDSTGTEIPIVLVDYTCYDQSDSEYIKPTKNIYNNLLKIRSKEKVVFRIPFNMKTTIKDNCWYGYEKELIEKNKQYYIDNTYFELNEYTKGLLSNSVKDSLNKEGYELYDKKIESNKVPLLLNRS
jgi:hypothetical protein